MNDFVKEAEKNCVNIAKHMSDMGEVIRALQIFGGRFFDERYDGDDFSKGVGLIRDAIYAKYVRSISDCFLFVGVGGKEAEQYSKEKFEELFGDKQNAIMHLLDQYGNHPSWYNSEDAKQFRKQALEKLEEDK